jgi:hypothetical protein
MIPCAFNFAFASTGNNMAARMAMMAITTSNSISVNARVLDPVDSFDFLCISSGFGFILILWVKNKEALPHEVHRTENPNFARVVANPEQDHKGKR